LISIAIYQPKYLSPNSTSLDASIENIFSAKIEGSYADYYQLIIYNLLTNIVVYDSTKLFLSPNLYQGEKLSHVLVPHILSNGLQYKYTFTVFSGVSLATSRETPFSCYSIPTLTMVVPSNITSKKYLFSATYTQSENIPINRWYAVFMDLNNNIILQTPYSYSAKLEYTYDGFVNSQNYKVYTVVENQQNVTVQSIVYGFSVNYSSPSLNFVPTATLLPELSAVNVKWSPATIIAGTVTGSSKYVPSLFTEDNTGLNLDSDFNDTDAVDESTTFDEALTFDEFYGCSILFNTLFGKSLTPNHVEFNVDIPMNFTALIDYIPSNLFTGGKMLDFVDDFGVIYEVGYDPELSCFYFKNDQKIVNGSAKELPLDVFLIAVKSIEVLIIVNNQIYEYLHL